MTAPTDVSALGGAARLGAGGFGAEVFAAEDTSIQVVLADLPAGDWEVEAGGQVAALRVGRPGPAAVVIEDLPPATDLDVTLAGPGTRRSVVARARTLDRPPGRLLGRIATISDLHLGSYAFGMRNSIQEQAAPGQRPFPWRCAHAALHEAAAWGAELMVVKGDLTATAKRSQLEDVGRLLAGSPVPVEVMLGNHEMTRRGADPWGVLGGWGIDVLQEVRTIDRPGVRVVLAHTPAPVTGRGRLTRSVKTQVVEAVASAPAGVLVFMHHFIQAHTLPTFYPASIPAPMARSFLADLGRARPDVLISSGHSHRNRRYQRRGVTLTEVGSTLHYPGVWAGYAVYEGGVRQVVRRIAEPSAMAWLERTKGAVGGVWGRWAPGRLEDRSFVLPWTAPAGDVAAGAAGAGARPF